MALLLSANGLPRPTASHAEEEGVAHSRVTKDWIIHPENLDDEPR